MRERTYGAYALGLGPLHSKFENIHSLYSVSKMSTHHTSDNANAKPSLERYATSKV